MFFGRLTVSGSYANLSPFLTNLSLMKNTIPNIITLFRIVMVPVFAISIYYIDDPAASNRWIPFWIFLVCALSDALDGILARALNARTLIGTVLDPVADKLLLLVAFVMLTWKGLIPVWLMILVVSRDSIIVGGVLILNVVKPVVEIMPRVWGKATTFIQMLTILMVLLESPSVTILIWMTLCVTFISGFDYIISGLRYLDSPHVEAPK